MHRGLALPRLVALAATIATAAAASAVVVPSAGAADQGYIPSCSPGCVLIVDGAGADRVFALHTAVERVAPLAVRGGVATDGAGGGIRSTPLDYLEYLYITDNSAVAGDAADSGFGGGIAASDGTIRYSTIAYNDAQNGGGVWYHGAQASSGSDLLLHNHA